MPINKKQLKLGELKTYISGAIEFNEEEWSPNKIQWDKIVEIILNVKDINNTDSISLESKRKEF